MVETTPLSASVAQLHDRLREIIALPGFEIEDTNGTIRSVQVSQEAINQFVPVLQRITRLAAALEAAADEYESLIPSATRFKESHA